MPDLRLKYTKFNFAWGSAPDPVEGAYSASPDTLAGGEGFTAPSPRTPFLALRASSPLFSCIFLTQPWHVCLHTVNTVATTLTQITYVTSSTGLETL